MAEKINLKELERKAWTTYFEDGFWDLFFGIMFLTAGLRGLTDNVLFTLGIFVALVVFIIGKRTITIPRIGKVKFGQIRRDRQLKVFVMIIVSLIAIMALLLLPQSGIALANIPTSPIMAIWIALFFAMLAYLMDFRRLYLYGLMFAMSEFLWGLFGKPLGPISNIVFGIIVVFITCEAQNNGQPLCGGERGLPVHNAPDRPELREPFLAHEQARESGLCKGCEGV
jgi:hypothetical protein